MRLCTNEQYRNTFTTHSQFPTDSSKSGYPWAPMNSSWGCSIWYREYRNHWKSFPSFSVLWQTEKAKQQIAPEKVKLKPLSHLTLLCGTFLQCRTLWAKRIDLFHALVQQNADLQFWKWHFIPPEQLSFMVRKEKSCSWQGNKATFAVKFHIIWIASTAFCIKPVIKDQWKYSKKKKKIKSKVASYICF